jgi:hypothetical protein
VALGLGRPSARVGKGAKRDDGMDNWSLNLRRLTSSEELAEEEWVGDEWGEVVDTRLAGPSGSV